MAKQKLKWADTEDIVFRLIDEYPKMDPLKVRFTDLHKFVTGLPEFGDNPKKSSESILENIQMRWHEERQDLEDDLGPVEGGTIDDDDDLDEDDYRDDEMVEDKDVDANLDDDDDEDEFGDGFQEADPDDD